MDYTDTDGTPLVFVDTIEKLSGWTNETIRHYASAGNRARDAGSVLDNYDQIIARADAADKALAVAADTGRATAGAERRAAGYRVQLRMMPKPVRKVKRTVPKANGAPLTVWSPLWREDHVRTWLQARGVLTG